MAKKDNVADPPYVEYPIQLFADLIKRFEEAKSLRVGRCSKDIASESYKGIQVWSLYLVKDSYASLQFSRTQGSIVSHMYSVHSCVERN